MFSWQRRASIGQQCCFRPDNLNGPDHHWKMLIPDQCGTQATDQLFYKTGFTFTWVQNFTNVMNCVAKCFHHGSDDGMELSTVTQA